MLSFLIRKPYLTNPHFPQGAVVLAKPSCEGSGREKGRRDRQKRQAEETGGRERERERERASRKQKLPIAIITISSYYSYKC